MLSIIIVNYKTESYVRACLASISRYCGDIAREIIVVDNHAGDLLFKADIVERGYKYIDSGGNIGFGRACNLGAHVATGSTLVFVNPDVTFTKNALGQAQSAVKEFGDKSIVGFNMVNANGEPTYCAGHFPCLTAELLELFYVHKWWPSLYKAYQLAATFSDEKKGFLEVDHVSGAFFAINAKTFHSLGGFSDKIFLYFEETELMYRHRMQGGRIVLMLEARASHIGSVVTSEDSDFKITHMELGRLAFYRTRYRTFLRIVTRVVRSLRLLVMGIVKRRSIYLRLIPTVLLGQTCFSGALR